jgi:hypothetical protein
MSAIGAHMGGGYMPDITSAPKRQHGVEYRLRIMKTENGWLVASPPNHEAIDWSKAIVAKDDEDLGAVIAGALVAQRLEGVDTKVAEEIEARRRQLEYQSYTSQLAARQQNQYNGDTNQYILGGNTTSPPQEQSKLSVFDKYFK